MTHRTAVLSLWIALAAAGLYACFFHPDIPKVLALELADAPPAWAYAVYLALGCIRGFTLVPVTISCSRACSCFHRFLFTS